MNVINPKEKIDHEALNSNSVFNPLRKEKMENYFFLERMKNDLLRSMSQLIGFSPSLPKLEGKGEKDFFLSLISPPQYSLFDFLRSGKKRTLSL